MSWGTAGAATGRSSVQTLIGHHASTMLIASILAAVAVGIAPPPGLLGLTLPLAIMALTLGSFLLMRKHDRQLCESCVTEIPLNPAEKAKHLGRRFWAAHTGSEPRFLLPYLVLLLGTNFMAQGTVGKALWAVVQLSLVYLVLSARTHRQLQPWCPWCSGGGGGEEVEQAPPPVLPHDDRQLT